MSNPYPFQESDGFSFEFLTDQEIRYSVYFIDYSYLFTDYPVIAPYIFSFNIEVLSGDPDAVPLDDRVGATIWSVFQIFFTKRNNAALYVCDSVDDRQRARKRKFDIWFWKYNDGDIFKEDGSVEAEQQEIYNAILLHKDNENLQEIVNAFRDLNSSVDKNQ